MKKKSRPSKSKAAVSDDDDDDDNDAKPLKPTPKPRKKSIGSAKKRKYGKQNVLRKTKCILQENILLAITQHIQFKKIL